MSDVPLSSSNTVADPTPASKVLKPTPKRAGDVPVGIPAPTLGVKRSDEGASMKSATKAPPKSSAANPLASKTSAPKATTKATDSAPPKSPSAAANPLASKTYFVKARTPEETYRERLKRYYEKYNPSKLSELDKLLEAFRGCEEAMFDTLVEKYGPEPSAVAAAPHEDVLLPSTSVSLVSQRRNSGLESVAGDLGLLLSIPVTEDGPDVPPPTTPSGDGIGETYWNLKTALYHKDMWHAKMQERLDVRMAKRGGRTMPSAHAFL